MSSGEIFNFLLKTGDKLMCVTGRARAAASWGCLLQPSLFSVVLSLRLSHPSLHQTGPGWKDKQPFSTDFYRFSIHTWCYYNNIQFWLKHKWPFSFQSVAFQNWHHTLFFQRWGTKFSCLKQEKFPDSQRSHSYFSAGLIKKPLCTSLLDLWGVTSFQDFLDGRGEGKREL